MAAEGGTFVVSGGEGDGARIVHLSGELDLLMVRTITPQVDAFLGTEPSDVVLDLAGIEFIDSTGVAMLIKIHSRVVKDRSGTVRIANPSTAALRTLDLCGLLEPFGLT